MSKNLMIFDLYGTLMEDRSRAQRLEYRANALYSLCESLGLPTRFSEITQDLSTIEERLATERKLGLGTSVYDLVAGICSRLNIHDVGTIKRFFDIWTGATLQIGFTFYPGVQEGLAYLAEKNKKIALISNTGNCPGFILRFVMQEAGILQYFDDLVFSDEIGLAKPRKLLFDRVLDRLEIPASDAIFFGDSEYYDGTGAHKAGIEYRKINNETDFLKFCHDLGNEE